MRPSGSTTFFMSNITPLFYIETFADLEKEVRVGKTPEQIVGEIAYKTRLEVTFGAFTTERVFRLGQNYRAHDLMAGGPQGVLVRSLGPGFGERPS